MPRYRFHAYHGPGHQGIAEQYKYYSVELTKEDQEDEWHDTFMNFDAAVGDTEHIKKLPDKERQQQILKYKTLKRKAENMLAMLEEQ